MGKDSLVQLEKSINHWLDNNLDKDSKVYSKGKERMTKMTGNMRRAFDRPQCGFFDPELRPNGKPRRSRRAAQQRDVMLKYSKKNSLLGLQQILLGYRYWSERYINECYGQRKFNYIAKRGEKLIRFFGTAYTRSQF